MSKIILEFELSENHEDYSVYYDLESVTVTDTDVNPIDLAGLVETLAQSDFGTIGFPYGIMEALDNPGEKIKFNHRM